MTGDLPDADHVADLLLPVDGPYDPDRVIEAARAVSELVRRLNHATRHRSTLPYPPQLYRTITPIAVAAHRMQQSLTQLASLLDRSATDPHVEHDQSRDPAAACADAAAALRQATPGIHHAAAHLDTASQITGHLGYDTRAARRRPATGGPLPARQEPPPHPRTPPRPRPR